MTDPLTHLRESMRQDNTASIRSIQDRLSAIERVLFRGYRGATVTTPPVPASGTFYTWPGPRSATIYLWGGTVTFISVTTVTSSITISSVTGTVTFRVNPGDIVLLSYSVTPTWVFYGD